MTKSKKQNNEALLELLENYQAALVALEHGQKTLEDGSDARAFVEQETPVVHKIVWRAGCGRIEAITPPTGAGNMIAQHVDPFFFVLEDPGGTNMAPAVIDMVVETLDLIKAGELPPE